MKKIWLAGGCFWGVEAYFQQLKGVIATTVGYGQGNSEQPFYQEVCTGTTGHAEICEVDYDETRLSLEKILEHYFRIIDPTTLNRQGLDRGTQYRTGVYYANKEERPVILNFFREMRDHYSKPIVVEVDLLRNFYPAEEYHQNYLHKNQGTYCHVNLGLAKPDERRQL